MDVVFIPWHASKSRDVKKEILLEQWNLSFTLTPTPAIEGGKKIRWRRTTEEERVKEEKG